jgi:hypothetical protein
MRLVGELLAPNVRPAIHLDSKMITLKSTANTKDLSSLANMDFSTVVETLNKLIARTQPDVINSSWIRTRAPRCYRFIRENLRRDFGGIDWDQLTYALEWKYQRRWRPVRTRKKLRQYEDRAEVETIVKKYRGKLYVFIAPAGKHDRRTRDVIGICFVRLAQQGNLLARQELTELLKFTIDDWIERYSFLACWQGHEDEIRNQLEACIRRYRYTGSFVNYVFRTLECAGRGIRPIRMSSEIHSSESGDTISD